MIPRPKFLSAGYQNRPPRGVALVIVLGFLVLITALVVAYFTSVTTERTASKSYASGASTKMLADTAVNVVEGQIAQATQGQVDGSLTRLTWASQPGMIRTYSADPSALSGSCYKLYSSGTMAFSPTKIALLTAMANDIPSGWNNQPALYTDLNAPVKDTSGNWNFPIMDGNNMFSMPIASLGNASALTYATGLNANPRSRKPDIEGVYVLSGSIPYQSGVALSSTNNPVPMPVQWLYTLQDGTIIAPDGGGNGTVATFNGAERGLAQNHWPSATNPIIGRIAFWTDDETCKLNINTACEGTYYDSPHLNTMTDIGPNVGSGAGRTGNSSGKIIGFGISPPDSGEYNRYPGHPASTCLSVVLGNWLGNPQGPYAPNAYTSVLNDDNYLGLSGTVPPTPSQTFSGLSAYMLLSPRNQLGGSMAGTVDEAINIESLANAYFPPVLSDTDRLYASIDEMMFRYPVTGDPVPPVPRVAFPNTNLTKQVGEEVKFFLTASSRAPELTPFDTPKISMWPQWYQLADRTGTAAYPWIYSGASGAPQGNTARVATEALLAFCSSFGNSGTNSFSGKNEYFVQRYCPGVSSIDGTNAESYSSSKTDWDAIPRNQEMAQYLYDLGTASIPGYGNSFVNKYGQTDFTNIAIESLDFIRSNIDMCDYMVRNNAGNGLDYGQYIAPLVVSSTDCTYCTLPGIGGAEMKGFGFYPICTHIVLGATMGTGTNTLPFLAFQCFEPSMDMPGLSGPGLDVIVENPKDLGLVQAGSEAPVSGSFNTGSMQSVYPPPNDSGPGTEGNWTDPIQPFCHALPSTWTFQQSGTGTGATILVGSTNNKAVVFDFYDPAGQNIVQKMAVTFPAVSIPVPTGTNQGSLGTLITGTASAFAYSARGVEESCQSPMNGDWRLLGGFVNLPAVLDSGSVFATSPNYMNSSLTQADSFRSFLYEETQPPCLNNTAGGVPTTSIAGTLVGGFAPTNYTDGSAPCVPAMLTNGALMVNGNAGDWDTGPGNYSDGPYLNPVEQDDSVANWQYFIQQVARTVANTFSPNRMVASPIRFGSLPTGLDPSNPHPWQTLLFCPNPAGRKLGSTTLANIPVSPLPGSTIAGADHVGFGNPPDHLYLEFFTMPVVQPYAISEPLSTAGVVNLNYQLAPFTYIERSTALRGVLKNTLLTAVSPNDVQGHLDHPSNPALASNITYKWEVSATTALRFPYELRYDINRDATIAGIDEHYFGNGQLFMYPAQICDVFLVPQYMAASSGTNYNPKDQVPPTTYDGMALWWQSMNMTGDNLREEPYNHLYPRLTTKSNSFTVHYRVQALQKRPTSNPAVWSEGQDAILSEYRGSSLIERYVDPNDPSLTGTWDSNTISLTEPAGGITQAPTSTSCDLSQLYKFRVISTKKFAP